MSIAAVSLTGVIAIIVVGLIMVAILLDYIFR